jgi:acyl-CoA thioesterase I
MFKKFISYAATAVIGFMLAACSGSSDSASDTLVIKKPTKATTVLVFGDSISQGYGVNTAGISYQQITPGNTYTELLRNRLQSENMAQFAPITVINASIGSEYTDEAALRLPGLLAQYHPTHVLLAHGTNDVGSDVPFDIISNNMRYMINLVYGAGAKPLLADVTFVRYGIDTANAHSKMTVDLSNATGAAYVPLLKGVVGDAKYYLPDGFHLNDLAQATMMSNLWNVLIPLFD